MPLMRWGKPLYIRVPGYNSSDAAIVRALITAGANVNAVDHNGDTVLMLAAGTDSAETIKALLDLGASINAKDKNGQTALMRAITGTEYLRVEKVKVLLAGGSDMSIRDNQGQTALIIARKTGDETIVKLLEEGTKP